MNQAQKLQLLERLTQTAEMAYYESLKRGGALSGPPPEVIRQEAEKCLRSGCSASAVDAALVVARGNARRIYRFYKKLRNGDLAR